MFDRLNLLLAQASANIPPAPPYKGSSYFFPQKASDFASEIDFVFYAIFWISTVFFAIIVGLMVYFSFKYRRREGHQSPLPAAHHNTPLELIWSIIPAFFLVWMFIVGAEGFFKLSVPRDDAEEIWVTASQFNWLFTYPDGDISNELHLVLDRPTMFIMESRDVLHSLFVPAFRQKQDIVPGRYTKTWVTPRLLGTYRLYCAEYCGNDHSNMKTNVTVWASEAERKKQVEWIWPDHPDEENGARLFRIYCAGCHNVNGTTKTGPPLNGKFGTEETLDDGSTLQIDENYIRESLLTPNEKVVKGFTRPSQMQSFQGKLNDDQIKWLIAYIKSLKDQ